ncbi:MAG: glutamate 5-kinase, partial [Myxococcota bacterium]
RARQVNLAATLQRLLALGAIPVINENDAVSTEELVFARGEVFADNDRLAALVAGALGADALVLLSNVDGVLTAPPDDPTAERVAVWEGQPITLGGRSAVGRGGMAAKIDAARIGARSGVTTVIANGGEVGILPSILAGEDVGTLFPAAPGQRARHAWLAFATVPAGRLEVDRGARDAVVQRKASLLPIGVTSVHGSFAAGAVVSLVHDGEEFARGLCLLSSSDAAMALDAEGPHKALVHRDNLVVLTENP